MTDSDDTVEKIQGINLVPEPTKPYLNKRQLVDYRDHRKKLIKWCLNLGKDPEMAEGYAQTTIRQRSYRLDKFYRWVWEEQEDGYTLDITTSHADDYMRHLAYEDTSSTYKATAQKAVKMLFKWQRHVLGRDVDWEPDLNFSSNTGTTQPRDFLTIEDRKKLREAALEYGTIPRYSGLTPEQRDKWRAHLAQRFEKPKDEVTPQDWERANGWKVPSLVWTTLDAGLRPIEVERAKVSWVDTDNHLLRIPKEDSSKNTDNWAVSLQDRTLNALKKWLTERKQYERYNGNQHLWLTRHGNPYNTRSLNYLMDQLCEEAEIEHDNRDVTWYSIRHSVGTYMTREEGLKAAQIQLRHKSERTTMRYDQAPVEDRKEALDKMG